MTLKNIILKTAELGQLLWQDVEKILPSKDGFIFFVDSYTETRNFEDNLENILIGKYIQTPFDHKPTHKELIDFIITEEYPNGKENQMLRIGIQNPTNEEFLKYYSHVEDIINDVKTLFN